MIASARPSGGFGRAGGIGHSRRDVPELDAAPALRPSLRGFLRALAIAGLVCATGCPPRTPSGGGVEAPTSAAPTSAGGPVGGGAPRPSTSTDADADATDAPSSPAGDPEADRERPDTGTFEETLESIPAAPRGRERPGLAGPGGCEGGTRAVGERWQVECNTCTCEASGEVACTIMACMPLR